MSNPSRTIQLGIVGCGKAAERQHLPALKRLPDVRVVAAADVDADRLKQVASSGKPVSIAAGEPSSGVIGGNAL